MTIQEARVNASALLQKSQIQSSGKELTPTPNLDADCLLAWVLTKERSWLLAHSQEDLLHKDEVSFFEAIKKRLEGFPVAYITQNKEFFGWDFFVTPDVLIPKPDTELLVEYAIAILERLLGTDSKAIEGFPACGKLVDKTDTFIHIADICTGSACIAVSVLKYLYENSLCKNSLPAVACDATDISPAALAVANRKQTSFYQRVCVKI